MAMNIWKTREICSKEKAWGVEKGGVGGRERENIKTKLREAVMRNKPVFCRDALRMYPLDFEKLVGETEY